MYQLELGSSKEGPHSKLSLASYTCTVFVSCTVLHTFTIFTIVKLVLNAYMLCSFSLVVLCCRAGWLLLSPRAGSHLAPSLVSTSPLLPHQHHPGPHTMPLAVPQSPLNTRFRWYGAITVA